MSVRKVSLRQRRISEYFHLLGALSRRELPWVCENPTEIEKLLALHSAGFLEARFDPPIVSRDGSRHIAQAVVTGVTAEGRLMLHKAAQAAAREISLPPSGFPLMARPGGAAP